jgi:hypothetical protein
MPEEKDDAANAGGEEGAEGGEEDLKGQEEILDDRNYQPETRKSVGEYVADRRVRRAEKQAKKEGEEEGEEGVEDEPDNASLIQEEVKKAVTPIAEFARTQATDSEINSFLAANPQFKKFEKLARKDAVAYPNTPISKIFRALAYDERGETANIIEAKKKEAENKKLGGSPQRKGISAPVRPSLISDEKLREVRLRVKTGEKINPLELE